MPKGGYSVKYLRAVVHHAKIYIRPLQQELDVGEVSDMVSEISEVEQFTYINFVVIIESNATFQYLMFQCPVRSPPKEPCLVCGKMVSILALREHIECCKSTLE